MALRIQNKPAPRTETAPRAATPGKLEVHPEPAVPENDRSIAAFRTSLERHAVPLPYASTHPRSLVDTSDDELQSLVLADLRSVCERRKSAHVVKSLARCGGPVLEVGSGSGRNVFSWCRQGIGNATGLDLDADAIRFATHAAGFFDHDARFVHGNLLDLPKLGLPPLGALVADSVLEHVRDYGAAVQAMHDALAPRGLAIVIVPSLLGGYSLIHDFDWHLRRWKGSRENYDPYQHCNHFWYTDLVRLFHRHGFRRLRTYAFQAYRALWIELFRRWGGRSGPRLPRWIEAIDARFARLLPRDLATRVVTFERC